MDLFGTSEIRRLFNNKFVVVIGDSGTGAQGCNIITSQLSDY